MALSKRLWLLRRSPSGGAMPNMSLFMPKQHKGTSDFKRRAENLDEKPLHVPYRLLSIFKDTDMKSFILRYFSGVLYGNIMKRGPHLYRIRRTKQCMARLTACSLVGFSQPKPASQQYFPLKKTSTSQPNPAPTPTSEHALTKYYILDNISLLLSKSS